MVSLQRGLHAVEFTVHGRGPVLPLTQHFQAHEVLTEDGGDEDAVFLGDDFFGLAAFFFDEQGGVAVFAAAHVAAGGEDVFALEVGGLVADLDALNAGVGWLGVVGCKDYV